MKRLLALMLTVCLLAAPVSAGAQEKITTEELIVGVLELIVSGLQSGRLDMTYAESGSEYGLVLGEDASGTPGGMLSMTEGGQTQLFGADGQGVFMSAGAWKEGDSLTGMSWESILRAVCTDENGVCWLPSFTEEDSQLFTRIGLQLVLSMADTVKVTESGSTIVIDVELGAFLDALDAAVPAALRAAAPQLDDFLARNNVVTYLLFDVEEPLTTETLIEIWSNLNIGDFVQGEMPLRLSITTDDETGDWNAVLAVADEGAITAQSTSGRIVATLTAEGESRVIFDSADLDIVMNVLAEALYFMPDDAFSYTVASDHYDLGSKVSLHLDVEELFMGFYSSLSMAVLANSDDVNMLMERYSLLAEMLFGHSVIDYATLAGWLRYNMWRDDTRISLARWWERTTSRSDFLFALFGRELPEIDVEFALNDASGSMMLSVSTNRMSLQFTSMGSHFSGMLQMRNNRSAMANGRWDISGFTTENRIELLVTANYFGQQRTDVTAVRLVCELIEEQAINCTLSACTEGIWADWYLLRLTPVGRNGVNAVLTDGQGTKMAELQADESGFLFRTLAYETPVDKRGNSIMPRLTMDPFEAELRVTDNGGRIRFAGEETWMLEWMAEGLVTRIALMCDDFTASFTEELRFNPMGTYDRQYTFRYNEIAREFEAVLAESMGVVSASVRYAANNDESFDMHLTINTNFGTLQYTKETARETTMINYLPGSLVMQTLSLTTGRTETWDVADVSEQYDNLNTTRIRWTRGKLSGGFQEIEWIVASNVKDNILTTTFTSGGEQLASFTLGMNPGVRAMPPVHWLTDKETRAVLSFVLYALEDEAESTEEPAG